MKKQILLFGASCLIYGNLHAQQIAPGLRDYPSGVVIKVYDVLEKVPLDKDAQLKLAEHFSQEEKALAASVLKGEKAPVITKLRFQYTENFHSLLKASGQLGNYKPEKNDQEKYHRDSLLVLEGLKTTGGVYNTVFTMRETLGLSTAQQETLYGRMVRYYDRMNAYRKSNPKGNFNVVLYNDLKNILTETQLNTYLTSKFSGQSEIWAVKKWKEMKQYSLSGKYDSTTIVNKIHKYALDRHLAAEHLMGNKQRQDEVVKAMTKNKPKELRELDFVVRNKAKTQNMTKTSFVW